MNNNIASNIILTAAREQLATLKQNAAALEKAIEVLTTPPAPAPAPEPATTPAAALAAKNA